MSKTVLDPAKLSLPIRRVIGNDLIQALRGCKWVRHTRALGNADSSFRVLGAHTSLRRQSEMTEEVERYLSFLLLPDPRIELPMLAVLLSGSNYEKAEKEAGSDFLSLTHLMKSRATAPYRIDRDRSGYRVRKNTNSGATRIALEALDTLVRYCLVLDVTPALANAFEDALADVKGASDVVAGAEILRQQLGIGSSL